MEYGPGEDEGVPPSPRKLPDDLPRSLDDRRSVPIFGQETEIYDAWQGKEDTTPATNSHGLTEPIRPVAVPYHTHACSPVEH